MTEYLEAFGTTILVGGIIFYAVMWLVARWLNRINANLEAQIEILKETIESRFVHLEVELDNGTYYCYNIKDRAFVCQGTTAKEIRDAFNSRYPERLAVLENTDKPELAELVKDVLEMKQNEQKT